MRAYAISLERAPERREHMERQLAGRDHEFIEAVDGRELWRREWPAGAKLTIVGAGLSHLRACRAVVRDGQRGLVLEDDAILPPDLDEVLEGLPDVDVALLYWRNHATLRGQVTCAGAYVITPDAAERMLDFNPPSRGLGPDAWARFPVEVWAHPDKPVSVRLDFPSTIGYRNGRLIPNWLRTLNRKRIERAMG